MLVQRELPGGSKSRVCSRPVVSAIVKAERKFSTVREKRLVMAKNPNRHPIYTSLRAMDMSFSFVQTLHLKMVEYII
jgi:hypothetical protein